MWHIVMQCLFKIIKTFLSCTIFFRSLLPESIHWGEGGRRQVDLVLIAPKSVSPWRPIEVKYFAQGIVAEIQIPTRFCPGPYTKPLHSIYLWDISNRSLFHANSPQKCLFQVNVFSKVDEIFGAAKTWRIVLFFQN